MAEETVQENALVVFEDKQIRRTWYNNEWWFVIEDIIHALTDSANPKQYIQKMKQRDDILAQGWVQIVHTLHIDTAGGKQRMNCVNTEGAFRIVQSIPSVKAEPFKLWLAKLGYERIQEIENPELGQDRIKEYYELKGYPKDWIEKRIRGIAIRQELTDEWKSRCVQKETDFAILTNEITKATFGKTVQEYKEFKGLQKNQNLRNNMTDWELILTMVGEKATKDITVSKDSQGLDECKDSAARGGTIARDTKEAIEKETGNKITSKENYLTLTTEKKKNIENKKNSN